MCVPQVRTTVQVEVTRGQSNDRNKRCAQSIEQGSSLPGNRPFHCFDALRAAAHEATNHGPRHVEAVCCQVLTRQSCQGACTCDLQHVVLSTSGIYHGETSSVAGRGNLEPAWQLPSAQLPSCLSTKSGKYLGRVLLHRFARI